MGIYSAGAAEAPLWLVLLMFASLQVVWTLLVRTFPSLLGSAFLRHLDHRFSEKLERTKADLQGAHTALKASVDFLSVGQAELRGKIIAAVELQWDMIRAIQNEFGGIILLETVLEPDEITDALQGKRPSTFVSALQSFRDDRQILQILKRLDDFSIEKTRLLVGDRLWLIFYVFRAVMGRMGVLLQRSFEEGRYVSWRDDQQILSLVGAVLPRGVIDSARSDVRGFELISGGLEAEFLREARRVMSGSQGFADALSDMQSALSYERQKISAEVR